jgi:hypothetical protein
LLVIYILLRRTESNGAWKALSEAEHTLKLTRDEAKDYGIEGDLWKKLDDLCLKKDKESMLLCIRML